MIRIVGVGSPFGDDAAGLEAARRLADQPPAESDVVLADRPGLALVNLLRTASAAIVIDSVHSSRVPGTVHDLDLAEVARLAGRRLTSHDSSLPEALALAEALGHMPGGRFLGIEIGGSDVASAEGGLTAAVERGVLEATARARRWAAVLIRQLREAERSSRRPA